jgi:hypothetical protein
MSEENLEIVRRDDGSARRDPGTLLSLYDHQAETDASNQPG